MLPPSGQTSLNVNYCGYWADMSGYGEANRNDIRSLLESGVKVTTQLPNQTNVASNLLGDTFLLARKHHGRPLDYKVKILHCTPDWYVRFLEPCKYHIGRLMWETDQLHPQWVWSANLLNEVWTACDYQKQALERSGVTVPITVIPQAVDAYIEPQTLTKPWPGDYIFYAVFQWLERKDWKSLLTAYWQEFKATDSVRLYIKTYIEKFTEAETQKIIRQIKELKAELGQTYYAPVSLCTQKFTKKQMVQLHSSGDCYVSAHRGEGFGIPTAEALACAKPVIVTNLGGVHEYLKPNQAYLVKWEYEPVHDMDHIPWYNQDQRWAKVDITDLRRRLRHVYSSPETARRSAKAGRGRVRKLFSYEAIGQQMKQRLKEIYKSLSA